MQIIVDGLLTNYLRSGKGKTILLLHGWGDSSLGHKALHQDLATKFDVITPDLPGFGNSQPPKEDWSLEDYSKFLSSFLKKLEVKGLHAVIGHSNGGAIAIKLVLLYDLPIDNLVLMSSAGIRNTASLKNKAILVGTKIGKTLTLPLPKTAKDKLRHRHYQNIGSDMLVNEKMSGTFKKIVAENILKQASAIKIPTLLIYGEKDNATPVEYGRMFHQEIEGSTLEIVTRAGHHVHLDDPAKVVKLIMDFLC